MHRIRSSLLLPLLVLTLVGSMWLPALQAPARGQSDEGRWVAPNGDDGGPGSKDRPWGSLGFALRALEAGDTLTVRGGEYREDLSGLPHLTPGTPRAPVLVRAADGEQPVLRGLLGLRGISFWTVDGLHVTWDDAVGRNDTELVKVMDGIGWTVRNVEISGARSYAGLYVGSNVGGQPRDWRVEDSCIHSTGAANPPFQDHNVYIQNGAQAGPGTLEGNVMHSAPSGTNVKIGAARPGLGEASNLTVRANTLYGATHNVLVAYGASDILMERNILGPVTVDRDDYPNIRGYAATGDNVVARDNLAFGAPEIIRNTAADSTLPVDYGVVDGGGNRQGDPNFAGVSCVDLVPQEPSAVPYGARSPITRIADSGRIETAAALSQRARQTPGATDTVIVARADSYPDALAGAPLAGLLDAPVILTSSGRLDQAAAVEVRRTGAQHAILLGGEGALSGGVVSGLRDAGVTDVERIAGDDRFATAAAIAARVADEGGGDGAYVVEGANADADRGWPDAVSVSALAARNGRPVLLTTRDDLPGPTRKALVELGVDAADVVGGRAAISEAVAQAVAAPADGVDVDVRRLAGDSRFATSEVVAAEAVRQGADPARVWLATGTNWPDALAAGPVAAADGGVLLLVGGTGLDASPQVRDWVRARRDAEQLHLVGGPGAIVPAVEDELARLLGPR